MRAEAAPPASPPPAGPRLAITLRFLHGRYHGRADGGAADWPPSPARLFQALVAAAATLPEPERTTARDALRRLEALPPPTIEAPAALAAEPYVIAVPNNDGDLPALAWAKGQEPKDQQKPEALRTLKPMRALILGDAPLVYRWDLGDGGGDGDLGPATVVAELAAQVTMLGWGIDAVAAMGAVTADPPPAGAALWSPGPGLTTLRVPQPGYLDALDRRHDAFLNRLDRRGGVMSSPPAATGYALARYRAPGEAEPRRWLAYRLIDAGDKRDGLPLLLAEPDLPGLVAALRERLVRVLGPVRAAAITLCPLPSIGQRHADGGVRRLLAVLPPGADARAVRELDVALDRALLEPDGRPLVLAKDDAEASPFLGFAVAPDGSRPTLGLLWRSVFPLRPADGRATPEAMRRAALRALAAAGVEPGRVAHLTVARASPWPHRPAAGPGALHVELELDRPHAGPLVPASPHLSAEGGLPPLFATAPLPTTARWVLAGAERPPLADAAPVTDRLRRAAMSQWGAVEPTPAPPLLSGRDAEGRILADPEHVHLFWLAEDADGDGRIDHLIAHARHGIPAPVRRALDRLTRLWLPDGREWRLALEGFGTPDLAPDRWPDSRPLAHARRWTSLTPWFAPWHAKPNLDHAAMIRRELLTRRLIRPDQADAVRIDHLPDPAPPMSFRPGRHPPDRRGAMLRLTLPHPLTGPLALGAECHFGMGVFVGEEEPA